jgi:hypothetical protein
LACYVEDHAKYSNFAHGQKIKMMSGGELLEIRLLDNHLLDTLGSKSIAQHKIYQLLESSSSWLNWNRANDTQIFCDSKM